MTPTTTISPMKGEEEYLDPYHPTTLPVKSTIPIVDIFSQEQANYKQQILMWAELKNYSFFVMGIMAAALVNLLTLPIRAKVFDENHESLLALYYQKYDINLSDKQGFLRYIDQKNCEIIEDYSINSVEFLARVKAVTDYIKSYEDLHTVPSAAVNIIYSQAFDESDKNTEFIIKNVLISLTVVLVAAGSTFAMKAVQRLYGKTMMELLSDAIDQVSAGAQTVAQTMGDAMELASETMDRWLAGANDYSEYEFELDGAATDVAGAECPVFIEDALLADGAVPELIVYPHSIAL